MKFLFLTLLCLPFATACSSRSSSTGTTATAPSLAPTPAPEAPTYSSVSAVLPGFVEGNYSAGQAIRVDFGVPANNANSYSYAFYRNGVLINEATGVTSSTEQVYVATSADSGNILSCIVTPSNSAGSGDPLTIPGIYIE